ncbi:UDP-N-acetylmuramate dehydrogenase [Oscillatoria sp. FACHB-1406]|uniref:UDP-N-acetylmuramate dehydrogenase n=1 Tax=Oscillatoria sp. FACHB-1406 TaxID=2692846 RepID=UPI0016895B90|nr:UDP-N-acetylmuramate dehydrogenase [Oscillatoria sp. FACHB-1406]MBD2576506.1 UDP-N-acetylmuramate dehydrogenase [Oscillatoria sp. FACHB-1406]
MTLSYDASGCSPTLFYGNYRPVAPSSVHLPHTDCIIRPQVPLGDFTTFRVGGPAEWYVVPNNIDQVMESFDWATERDLPITLLGAGSNLLISDRGIPGLVVGTRHLRGAEFDSDSGKVTVGAGESIARIAWQAAKRGWTGFEWGVGIPGSIGGCVVMNAGAHSSCMADVIESVVVLEPDGTLVTLKPEDLGYCYRTSSLQGDKRLVLQATLQLQPGSTRSQVMATTNQNLQQRKSTQPYHLPSCGSVFRNHDTHKAGWLIEQLGLKGYQIGGAQIAHRHANFILNCGGAKANDIFQLIRHVQEQVEAHWSLSLHPEVKLLGEF